MKEQENRQFQNATCRGAYALGTACGHCERCDIDPLNPKNATPVVVEDTTQDGKVIKKTEHPDGRKDVHIEVNMLDVKDTDPDTLAAKKVIEEQIFPKLADADVLVVVVHKPTNQMAQKVVKAPHVRKYAEACVREYNKALSAKHGVAGMEAPTSEFVVVEHHITNGTVQLSTL